MSVPKMKHTMHLMPLMLSLDNFPAFFLGKVDVSCILLSATECVQSDVELARVPCTDLDLDFQFHSSNACVDDRTKI